MSKPKKTNLLGIEAVRLLQQGHMVRRSCWVKDFYIRITNEAGFDENGNCIPATYKGEQIPIYTHATSGYFLHIAHSSQPFDREHGNRAGEGIYMLFENDWEDYGFISDEDFDKLVTKLKEAVRERAHRKVRLIE